MSEVLIVGVILPRLSGLQNSISGHKLGLKQAHE